MSAASFFQEMEAMDIDLSPKRVTVTAIQAVAHCIPDIGYLTELATKLMGDNCMAYIMALGKERFVYKTSAENMLMRWALDNDKREPTGIALYTALKEVGLGRVADEHKNLLLGKM